MAKTLQCQHRETAACREDSSTFVKPEDTSTHLTWELCLHKCQAEQPTGIKMQLWTELLYSIIVLLMIRFWMMQ